MTNKNKNLIIGRKTCNWRPPVSRRKGNFKISGKVGSVNPMFIVLFFAIIAGVLYLYSINGSAVKGYQIKQVEKEIGGLKQENEKLKIREAELNSLYKIEEESESLNMTKPNEIVYIEEKGPVALK